jgi:large repetitive protein
VERRWCQIWVLQAAFGEIAASSTNVFFSAAGALYKSDGITTAVVSGCGQPSKFTLQGSLLFMDATSAPANNDHNLYTHDGTTLTQVSSLGSGLTFVVGIANISGTIYWIGNNTILNSSTVFKYNSANNSTSIHSVGPGDGISNLTAVGTKLFYTTVSKLYVYDTGASTNTDITPSGVSIGNLASDGTTLYCRGTDASTIRQIYKSTGSTPTAVTSGGSATRGWNPSQFAFLGTKIYFSGSSNDADGLELCVHDTGTGTTSLVIDLFAGGSPANSSSPRNLTFVGSTIYFSATTATSIMQLFKTDGTSAGTVRVGTINTSNGNDNPQQFANIGGTLYFRADNDTGTNFVTRPMNIVNLTISAGNGQTTPISNAFAAAMQIAVKSTDNASNFASVPVTFTAPGSGASGTFSNSTNTITVISNASGISSSGTFSANATFGSYSVTTSIPGGYSTGLSFSLMNSNSATVNSINRQSPAGAFTNASSVTFRITFSTSVTGVTASNFDLNPTVTGATIGTVSGSGTTWDIQVNSITGNGFLGLRLANATGIIPPVASALPASGQQYTIDKVAPAAPVISSITTDSGTSNSDLLTNDTTLVISGTAEANSILTLTRVGTGVLGTATVGGGGAWSYDYTGTTLSEGSYTFAATTQDAAGNISADSANFVVNIDTTPPAVPAITSISNDTGTSNDRITSDPTLLISGTADANSIVSVSRTGVGVLGSATANGTGNWTFDYTGTTLGSGNHTFTASASDAAGNSSGASADFAVTVDTSAPAAPVLNAISTDTGSSNTDEISNDTTLVISGTAEANSSLTLTLVGTGVLGTANVTAGSTWSYDYTGTPLANGSYTFTATAQDAAGNASAVSANFVVNVDLVAPAAPVITSVSTDTGNPNDAVTSDQTLILSGTSEANSVVTVTRVNVGILGTATANGAGIWNYDYTTTTLPAGTHTFTATAQDAAGNVSAVSANFNVTVDTNAPATPVIDSITLDSGTAGDGVTNDNTLVLNGTAPASSTVTLTRVGIGVIGTTTADGTGNWNFDYTSTALIDGNFSFTATATSSAGITSPDSNAFAVRIDTVVAPAAITGFSSDTGSAGDGQTSDGTLILNGTAEANSIVTLNETGLGTLGTTTANGTGNWTFDYSATILQPGTYNFSANAVDVAGNMSAPSANRVVTITGPAVSFTVAGFASPATAGVQYGFTVTAKDASGNVADNYAGTLAFSSNDPQAVLPANYTFVAGDNGVHSFNATLKTAGTRSITVTDSGNANVGGSQMNISVLPIAADHLGVVAPANSAANAPFNFTVNALDQFGNVDPAYAGTVHFTSSDSAAVLPADASLSSGTGTFSATLITGNVTQTLTATDTVSQSITAGSASILVARLPQTITFVPPTGLTFGDLPVVLTATSSANLPVGLAYVSGPGTLNGNTLTITGAGEIVINAGQPGNTQYEPAPDVPQSINVAKTTVTVSWSNPASIIEDVALSTTQLNATASVPGTFAYTPAPGSFLPAGTNTLTVQFTPTDSANYATPAPVSVQIQVNEKLDIGSGSLPTEGVVNQIMTFSISPNFSNAIITWDWNDGTPEGTGSTVTHTYTSAGTYNITVTITDPITNQTETKNITLVIDTGLPFSVAAAVVGLDFGTKGKDYIKIRGRIPLAQKDFISGDATIDFGGVVRKFSLKRSGRAYRYSPLRTNEYFSLLAPYTRQTVTFQIRLLHQDIVANLADEGLKLNAPGTKTVRLIVSIGSASYLAQVKLNFKENGTLGRGRLQK